MPTRRQLIQKTTLNANSNSITFSNIPQNYTDLKIFVSARATGSYDATPWVTASFRFNGSSSGYTARTLFGTGSASGSDSNAGGPLLIPDTDSTSGTFGNSNVYIPNYSSTSITKSLIATSVTENNGTSAAMWNYAMSWSNTSPITSIQITSGAGDLAANSTFYLYGITHVPIIRGGEVTVPGDGFKYHTFRSSGSLQVIEPGDVEFIAIGGGGGGGGNGTLSPPSGGGGAGGRFFAGKARASQGISSVVVGSGGSFDNAGTSSSIISLTSSGGNFGLRGGQSAGGVAFDSNSGSGGTSGLGTSIAPTVGGNGTNQYANILNAVSAGQSGRAAAGGGGGGWDLNGANGGLGGGGKGGNSIPNSTGFNGENGVINTGSGGGGSGAGSTGTPFGGSGGSGIVIIRYPYDGN